MTNVSFKDQRDAPERSTVLRLVRHFPHRFIVRLLDTEMVSFNDVVERYLLSPLLVKEMPHLAIAVPGFTAALVRWMMDTTYSGRE